MEDNEDHAIKLLQSIGSTLDLKQMQNILVLLKDHQIITAQEAKLIRGIIQQEVSSIAQGKDVLRASLLRSLLFYIIKSES